MSVRLILELVIDEILFSIFWLIILSLASTKTSLFNFLALVFFDSFAIEFTNDITPLVGRLNISGKSSIHPPNCTILDNWVFENLILVDKPFAKALWIF